MSPENALKVGPRTTVLAGGPDPLSDPLGSDFLDPAKPLPMLGSRGLVKVGPTRVQTQGLVGPVSLAPDPPMEIRPEKIQTHSDRLNFEDSEGVGERHGQLI